jgi:hypothetical protein
MTKDVIQSKRTEEEQELFELEALLRARDMFERDLELAFNWPKHMPATKAGSGRKSRPAKGGTSRRPSKWKDRHGFEFVAEIYAIQARDTCGVMAAIRQLQKDNPKKWSGNPRLLAQRFNEVRNYWGPWVRSGFDLIEKIRAMEAKIEARSQS